MRVATAKQSKKGAKISEPPALEHSGRSLIPMAYMLGVGGMLGGAWLALSIGQVSMVPAILLPWAGFYWARLFFWRGRV